MALTFGDFLSIFTTNDASGGRAIKATFDTGIDDAANYLTKSDPAGGRAIKVINVGAPLGPQFWGEAYNAGTQATSSWTPAGAATNINAAIIPKGTGAIVAAIPDGTATGGNARGTYAVDLQVTRSAATQVASANYTTILGGRNNTNRSSDSVLVAGNNNIIWNHRFNGHGVIVGGQNNRIGNADSSTDGWNFIGGGINNSALALDSCVIVGGNGNTVGGFRSSVVGGASNNLGNNTQSCFIGGGESNAINSSVTSEQKGMVIVGGFSNTNTSQYGFIGAGQTNSNTSNQWSSIVGGLSNSITNSYAFIGGGQSNTASGQHAVVCGGWINTASNSRTFIGSGESNTNMGAWGVIGGGQSNFIGTNSHVAICGGQSNSAGAVSFVGGGLSNAINSSHGIIGGGQANTISAQWGTIAGGQSNTASGSHSVVGGGQSNTASGVASTITGGLQGTASLYGQVAHAAGQFSAAGDAQAHELVWRRATIGTANWELFLDGSGTAAVLPGINSVWHGILDIVAVCTETGNGTTVVGDVFAHTYKVAIKKVLGTVSLVGTAPPIGGALTNTSMSTNTISITADTSRQSLRIVYTPPTTAGSTTTIRVVATYRATQIEY